MRIEKSDMEIELKDRQRKIDSHKKTMKNVEEEYRKNQVQVTKYFWPGNLHQWISLGELK